MKWNTFIIFILLVPILIVIPVSASNSIILFNSSTIEANSPNSFQSTISVTNLTDVSKIYFSIEYDPTLMTISTMRVNTSVIGDLQIVSEPDSTDWFVGTTRINNGIEGKGQLFVNLKSDSGITITDLTPILDFIIVPTNKSGSSDLTFGQNRLYKTITGTDYILFNNSINSSISSTGVGSYPFTKGTILAPTTTIYPGFEKLASFRITDVDNIQRFYLKFGTPEYDNAVAEITMYQENSSVITGLHHHTSGGGSNGTYQTKYTLIEKDSPFSVTSATPIQDIKILTEPGKTSGSQTIDLMDCYFTNLTPDGVLVSYPFGQLIDGIITVQPDSADTQIILPSHSFTSYSSDLMTVNVTNLTDVSKIFFSINYDPTLMTISTMRANTSIIGDLQIISDPDSTRWFVDSTRINNGVEGKGQLFVNLNSNSGITITDQTPILDFIIVPTNKSGSSDLTFGQNRLYKKRTAQDYVKFFNVTNSSVSSSGQGYYPYINGLISAPTTIAYTGIENFASFRISNVDNIQKVFLKFGTPDHDNALVDIDLSQINPTIAGLHSHSSGGGSNGTYQTKHNTIEKDSSFSVASSTPIQDIKITTRTGKTSGSQSIDLFDCYFTNLTSDGIFVSYPFSQSVNGIISLQIAPTSPTTIPTISPSNIIKGDSSDSPNTASSIQQDGASLISGVNVGGNSAINQVSVTGVGAKEIIVTAEQKTNHPIDAPSIGTPVYQYIEITPARFTSISSAAIEFSVPRSWIEQQKADIGTIALSRLHDGIWTTLPTSFKQERNGLVYYEAHSPGFSTFAIIVNPKTKTSSTTKAEVTQTIDILSSSGSTFKDVDTEQQPNVTSGTKGITQNVNPQNNVFSRYPILFGLIVTGSLILSIFLFRRWWIRRQNPALFKKYE